MLLQATNCSRFKRFTGCVFTAPDLGGLEVKRGEQRADNRSDASCH